MENKEKKITSIYSIIFKITNKVVYAGQTDQDPKERFDKHLRDSRNKNKNSLIAKAIREFGEDNFYFRVEAVTDNQEEADRLEHYYVHFYNCLVDGYNEKDPITKYGGNPLARKTPEELEKFKAGRRGGKNPSAKVVIREDRLKNKNDRFTSIVECAKDTTCSVKCISVRLNGRVTSLLNGRYWFREESVSTTGGECSQVGGEISTPSKRETSLMMKREEDIVSTSGNRGIIVRAEQGSSIIYLDPELRLAVETSVLRQ